MNLLVTDDKTQDSYMLLPKARLARSVNKNNVSNKCPYPLYQMSAITT